MAQASVAPRARAPGAVRAAVERIDGRPVVVARMDATERRGALSSTASATLAEAARTARDQRLPLVAFDRLERRRHPRGHGRPPRLGPGGAGHRRLLGLVPVIIVLDGPAVSGPALLIGLADFVVMTEESYAFVSGPVDGGRVHRRDDRQRRARRSDRPCPPQRRGHRSWSPDTAAARSGGGRPPRLPAAHTDEEPPRWPTDDPPDRPTPEAGAAPADDRRGQLRRARRDRCAIVDDGLVVRAAEPVGAERRHGLRHHRRPAGRDPGQPALGHRRHPRHPGIAEGRPVRGVLRRVQPADRDARRHPRLLPRQGPRVAGDDPPRRAARVRLRPGDGGPHLRDPAQELRRAPTSSWTPSAWATTSAWPGPGPSWR